LLGCECLVSGESAGVIPFVMALFPFFVLRSVYNWGSTSLNFEEICYEILDCVRYGRSVLCPGG
jgi:hypothetical protein